MFGREAVERNYEERQKKRKKNWKKIKEEQEFKTHQDYLRGLHCPSKKQREIFGETEVSSYKDPYIDCIRSCFGWMGFI